MRFTPKFAHDCSHCVFTGGSATHDFYLHGSDPAVAVVVARFGEDEGDYSAMPLEHARMMEQPNPAALHMRDHSPLYIGVLLADMHMAGTE
jgi:hypothetical protein